MPALIDIIIRCLNSWRFGHKKQQLDSTWTGVKQSQEQLDLMGTNTFMDGFLQLNWIAIQQSHYNHIATDNGGKHWVSEVIKLLWALAWDMWSHRHRFLHTKNDQQLLCYHDDLNRQIIGLCNKFAL